MGTHLSTDEEFMALASQYKADEDLRQRNIGRPQFKFDEISYTALERAKPKIVRFMGEVPESGKTPSTARIIQVAEIVCDDGKTRQFYLPRNPTSHHILWEIINRVKQFDFIDKDGKKKKIFPVKESNPDIFNLIDKNGKTQDTAGLPESKAKQKMYDYNADRGWVGREMFVANVIDREKMDWHRANKKLLVLSKSMDSWEDQKTGEMRTRSEVGVPVYGFFDKLVNEVLSYYGHFSQYDVLIIKNGLLENPYTIFNASKELQKVPANVRNLVNQDSLTAEEESWEGVNLQKIFADSSSKKVKDFLSGKIRQIDLALGTTFMDRLDAQVRQEANYKKAGAQEKVNTMLNSDSPKENTSSFSETVLSPKGVEEKETSKRRSKAPLDGKKAWDDKYSSLGWVGKSVLSEEHLALIDDIEENIVGGVKEYNLKINTVGLLPHLKTPMRCDCGLTQPAIIDSGCLKCGSDFSDES